MKSNDLLSAFQKLHKKCLKSYQGLTPQIVGNCRKAIIEEKVGLKRLVNTCNLMTRNMDCCTAELREMKKRVVLQWLSEEKRRAFDAIE